MERNAGSGSTAQTVSVKYLHTFQRKENDVEEKTLTLHCEQCCVEVLFILEDNGEAEVQPLVPLCRPTCKRRLEQLLNGDCSLEEQ